MTATLLPRLDVSVRTEPALLAARDFNRDRLAPAAARRLVTDVLAKHGADPDTVETAELLTSELVTNAALYANRGLIHVRVEAGHGRIRVVVTDAGRDRVTVAGAVPDANDEHHRGWLLVELLSAECGVERLGGGNGNRCWFLLDAALTDSTGEGR